MIKARYERVELDVLGYKDGWGEVKINPTRDETREFREAQQKIQKDTNDPAFLTAAAKVLGKCHLAEGEDFDLSDVKVLEEIDGGNGDPILVSYLINEFVVRRGERIERSVEPFRRLRLAEPERTGQQPEVAAAPEVSQ